MFVRVYYAVNLEVASPPRIYTRAKGGQQTAITTRPLLAITQETTSNVRQ
jgi:hypothetical protein